MKLFILALFGVFTFVLSAPAKTKQTAHGEYKKGPDGTYYRVIMKKQNWDDANAHCELQGAHLLLDNSPEIHNYIMSIPGGKHFWIGATDKNKEGVWKWTDGSSVDTGYWAKGQPGSDHGKDEDEDCGLFLGNGWHDAPCKSHYAPYVCQKGGEYKKGPDGTYYRLIMTPQNWDDAKDHCELQGAHLLLDNSPEIHNYIMRIPGGKLFWIGATDKKKEGVWKWTDGSSVVKAYWAKGQPGSDNGKDEDCGLFLGNGWHDAPCKDHYAPYVCQKEVAKHDEVDNVLDNVDAGEDTSEDDSEEPNDISEDGYESFETEQDSLQFEDTEAAIPEDSFGDEKETANYHDTYDE